MNNHLSSKKILSLTTTTSLRQAGENDPTQDVSALNELNEPLANGIVDKVTTRRQMSAINAKNRLEILKTTGGVFYHLNKDNQRLIEAIQYCMSDEGKNLEESVELVTELLSGGIIGVNDILFALNFLSAIKEYSQLQQPDDGAGTLQKRTYFQKRYELGEQIFINSVNITGPLTTTAKEIIGYVAPLSAQTVGPALTGFMGPFTAGIQAYQLADLQAKQRADIQAEEALLNSKQIYPANTFAIENFDVELIEFLDKIIEEFLRQKTEKHTLQFGSTAAGFIGGGVGFTLFLLSALHFLSGPLSLVGLILSLPSIGIGGNFLRNFIVKQKENKNLLNTLNKTIEAIERQALQINNLNLANQELQDQREDIKNEIADFQKNHSVELQQAEIQKNSQQVITLSQQISDNLEKIDQLEFSTVDASPQQREKLTLESNKLNSTNQILRHQLQKAKRVLTEINQAGDLKHVQAQPADILEITQKNNELLQQVGDLTQKIADNYHAIYQLKSKKEEQEIFAHEVNQKLIAVNSALTAEFILSLLFKQPVAKEHVAKKVEEYLHKRFIKEENFGPIIQELKDLYTSENEHHQKKAIELMEKIMMLEIK